MSYIYSIDFFKGVLIFLVVIGHYLQGVLGETLSRYFIYSFHMPFFIGISGYLFNLEGIEKSKKEYIKTLCRRIIKPYIIANIIYGFLINYKELIELEYINFILDFIKTIIISYYHLWYIQGYISYMIITYILIKIFKLKSKSTIICGLFISIFTYYMYFYYSRESIFLNIFLNNFRIYNLIFFLCGFYIKYYKINLKNNKKELLLFLALFLTNSIGTFYIKNPIINGILFYLSNLYGIMYILTICIKYKNIKIKFINFIGKKSLYIYLYHIVPLFILKEIFKIKINNQYIYYSIIILLSGIVMANKSKLKKTRVKFISL